MDKTEIDKAFGAHSLWKASLKLMILTGKRDIPVNEIEDEHECDFGKWLYGPTIPPEQKTSVHYEKVKDLHAEFHKTAAKVAKLATTGKVAEAEILINLTGEFTLISNKLTTALIDWKESI
jgi:methyl-accepting chemotaxis protein